MNKGSDRGTEKRGQRGGVRRLWPFKRAGRAPPHLGGAGAGSRNTGGRAGAPGSRAGARGRSTCGGRRRARRPVRGRRRPEARAGRCAGDVRVAAAPLPRGTGRKEPGGGQCE